MHTKCAILHNTVSKFVEKKQPHGDTGADRFAHFDPRQSTLWQHSCSQNGNCDFASLHSVLTHWHHLNFNLNWKWCGWLGDGVEKVNRNFSSTSKEKGSSTWTLWILVDLTWWSGVNINFIIISFKTGQNINIVQKMFCPFSLGIYKYATEGSFLDGIIGWWCLPAG